MAKPAGRRGATCGKRGKNLIPLVKEGRRYAPKQPTKIGFDQGQFPGNDRVGQMNLGVHFCHKKKDQNKNKIQGVKSGGEIPNLEKTQENKNKNVEFFVRDLFDTWVAHEVSSNSGESGSRPCSV